MLEITTFLLYCCLSVLCICAIFGMIALTYVYISNVLKAHKRNKHQMEKLDGNY